MSKRVSELYFEEVGDIFGQWTSDYDVRQRAALLRKFLPADASALSCLEVGCGVGNISRTIRSSVGQLTVSDVSARLAERVGEGLGVPWMRQDACELTVPDESYDLVVSSECIEHTPDPTLALAEIGRVVRKGGWAIVTAPNKLWYPLVVLSQRLKIRPYEGNEIWLFPWQAANILTRQGFRDVRLGGCHLLPWQLPGARRILPFFDRFDRFLYPFMINWGICGRKPAA